jgi:hypothetical protein
MNFEIVILICVFCCKHLFINKSMRRLCVRGSLKETLQLLWSAVWMFNEQFFFCEEGKMIRLKRATTRFTTHVLASVCPLNVRRPNSCLVKTRHLTWRPTYIYVTFSPFSRKVQKVWQSQTGRRNVKRCYSSMAPYRCQVTRKQIRTPCLLCIRTFPIFFLVIFGILVRRCKLIRVLLLLLVLELHWNFFYTA